jgi:hypothetical protein
MSGIDAPDSWGGFASQNGDLGEIVWLGDVTMKPVEFVERPLLQAATFHLLAGRPEVGKGALCARWLSRCTNGEMYGEPRPALWLSTEEDPAIDLGPRIEVAGGNRAKVGLIPKDFRLPRDTDWLRATTLSVPGLGLVVIDYLESHDGNSDGEVRSTLLPLATLASELSVPMLGIRHISVKEARGNVLGRILGSTAWVGVPRVVLVAVKDKQDNVHVHPIKGNRIAGREAGREYVLEGRPLLDFPETIVCAVERGVSDADVDDLLAGTADTVSQEAEEIMLRIVTEEGEIESDTLDARICAETGLAGRTVKNVRFDLQRRTLLKASPERGLDGTIERWWVRPSGALSSFGSSRPPLKDENSVGSLWSAGGAAVPPPEGRKRALSPEVVEDPKSTYPPEKPESLQMPLSPNGGSESLEKPTLPPDAPEWEKKYWEKHSRER